MSDLSWSFGKNDKLEWLQYGNTKTKDMKLTITRQIQNAGLQILLHDATEAAAGVNPPEYASFSLETGSGEQTLGVDGVGFLIEMSDGRTGFQTALTTGDGLRPFRAVFDSSTEDFRIWVNEKSYTFPVGLHRKALQGICR